MTARLPASLLLAGPLLIAQSLASAADPSNTARVTDLNFGTQLAPAESVPGREAPDADGLSLLHEYMLRTPSGHLYSWPGTVREPANAVGDWTYDAIVGLGYISDFGDTDSLWFRQYADWGDDLAVEFALALEREGTGQYLEFRGSRLNEQAQVYRLRAGSAGSYRIEAYYRDLPHIVSTTAFPIWNGVGSETLTLPDSLTPGGSTPAQVAAVSDAASRSTVRVDRSRTGVSIEGTLWKQWTGFVSLANEEREGTRLWGGPMFFAFIPDNGGVNESVRPIDFSTTDVHLGARFNGSLWRLNASYHASFFRNHKDRLDYESPFIISPVIPGVPPVAAISQGQYSLEPDNDYHNLRVEAARTMAWNGEVSFAAAVGTMRQDDDLLPAISCTGMGGIFLGPGADYTFDCADWNTPAALSRQSADARIDTLRLDARAVFRPTYRLGWRAHLRHYAEDNKTRYLAYNPVTGQYGYIAENGSQGSVVPGETGIFDPSNPLYASYNVPIRNMPFEYSQTTADLGVDWRPGDSHSFGLTYTFDRLEPEPRERDYVNDHRLELAWTWAMDNGSTLRTSYEIADRSGGDYDPNPYHPYYSSGHPDFVMPPDGVVAHTVDAMRKYDLADRVQNKLRAIYVHPFGTTSTLSATLYGNYNDYDAEIGRRGDWTTGATLQWDYQPAPEIAFSAYAGYDYSHLRVGNVADDEANLTPDASLGGATFPLDNRWTEDDREDSYHAGATLRRDFGRYTVEGAYSFVYTQGEIAYDYVTLGAVSNTQQPFADQIGNAFPGNYYRLHAIDLSLTAALSERLTARLFGRYELGDFADFHYAGFEDGLVYDHRVYTDRGPARSYEAGLIGVMFRYRP